MKSLFSFRFFLIATLFVFLGLVVGVAVRTSFYPSHRAAVDVADIQRARGQTVNLE